MSKIGIFIDGAYLENTRRAVIPNQSINYQKLVNRLIGQDKLVTPALYYNAHSTARWEENKFLYSLSFIPNLELRIGRVAKQIYRGIEVPRQKRVDTQLTTDMIWLVATKQIEKIHLIGGDDDFVPPVRQAVEHNIQVISYVHADSASQSLIDWSNQVVYLDYDWLNQDFLSSPKREFEFGNIASLLN